MADTFLLRTGRSGEAPHTAPPDSIQGCAGRWRAPSGLRPYGCASCSAGSGEPVPERDGGRLAPRVHAELLVDVFDLVLDRSFGDAERSAIFARGFTPGRGRPARRVPRREPKVEGGRSVKQLLGPIRARDGRASASTRASAMACSGASPCPARGPGHLERGVTERGDGGGAVRARSPRWNFAPTCRRTSRRAPLRPRAGGRPAPAGQPR